MKDADEELVGNSYQKHSDEYIMLKFQIRINKSLYEKNIVTYEVFNEMNNMIAKKLNKIVN